MIKNQVRLDGRQPILQVKVVSDPDEMRAALGVRYRAYEADKHIPFSETGIYTDKYDEMGSTLQLAVIDERGIVGTLRLCFSVSRGSADTMPCAAVYPEVGPIRQAFEGPIVELSRLAIDPSITNTSYKTTLYAALVRAGLEALHASGARLVFLAARATSLNFYERILGFKAAAEPRFYPPGDIPITLTSLDMRALNYARLRNKFFKTANSSGDLQQRIEEIISDVFAPETN